MSDPVTDDEPEPIEPPDPRTALGAPLLPDRLSGLPLGLVLFSFLALVATGLIAPEHADDAPPFSFFSFPPIVFLIVYVGVRERDGRIREAWKRWEDPRADVFLSPAEAATFLGVSGSPDAQELFFAHDRACRELGQRFGQDPELLAMLCAKADLAAEVLRGEEVLSKREALYQLKLRPNASIEELDAVTQYEQADLPNLVLQYELRRSMLDPPVMGTLPEAILSYRRLGRLARIAATALLTAAVIGHPLSSMTTLRWVVSLAAIAAAIQEQGEIGSLWPTGFWAIAFLFNPLVPLSMSAFAWRAWDVPAILLFAGSLRPRSHRKPSVA